MSGTFAPDPAISSRLDTVLGALSDRRQRYVLYKLSAMDGDEIAESRLVDAVYGPEMGNTDVRDERRKNAIEVDLCHNRLPRLEDAGFIEYDRDSGVVRYDGSPLLEEWLERARDAEA